MTPRTRRLGMLLAIISGTAFLVYAMSAIRLTDLVRYLTVRTMLAILAAAVAYALTVPLSAWAWGRLLAALGCTIPLYELNRILLTTQIGKYLPGNIGQHLGRIGLSLSRGVPGPVLIASLAYEILLLVLAGALTGLTAGLFSSFDGAALWREHGGALLLPAVVAVAGLLLVPLFGLLLPRAIRYLAPNLVDGSLNLRLAMAPALLAFGAYVTAFLLIGIGIGMLSVSLSPSAFLNYPLLTAAFAIAWVAGFATPGAPAGIGIRESVLTLILGSGLGASTATVLVLALRVATTFGDCFCLITGLLLSLLRRQGSGVLGPSKAGSDV